MAARDVEFYNYLKEALKNKVRYPEADSFRFGKYYFDYDYIFQQARRVLPAKYNIAHSSYNGIPISFLHNKEDLHRLNLEYAQDVVKGFGGLDATQADKKEVDEDLSKYENILSAKEEPDSFYQELETHQLPLVNEKKTETTQAEEPPAQQEPPSQEEPTHNKPQHQHPPHIISQPLTNKERFETKEEYAKYKEANKEVRSERAKELWAQRKAEAPPSRPPSEKTEPSPNVPIVPPLQKEEKKEEKRRWLPKLSKSKGGNFPFARQLARWGGRLARGAIRGLANIARTVLPHIGRAISALGRGLMNLGGRLAGQLAGMAGRSLITGIGSAVAGVGIGAILGWTLVIGISLFFLWSLYDSNSECGKVGTVLATKTSDKQEYSSGENINYVIKVIYNVKCTTDYADITIRDIVPTGTTFVDGSTKPGPLDKNFYLLPPEGVLDGNTVTWTVNKVPANIPIFVVFSVKPNEDNIWISNQATISYKTYSNNLFGSPNFTGSRIIDTNSASMAETITSAAQFVGMDPALLKAIIKVEAGTALKYSEEEFQRFSTPGWWENASPDEITRGYAYNTCDNPKAGCGAGNDVRGVAQFELATWNGIASKIKPADGHTPDRRIARDAIIGSAILNRRNAEAYSGTSDVQWTEDVIRAMARMYCAGPAAGRNPSLVNARACTANGRLYDDLFWDYYKEYSNQP